MSTRIDPAPNAPRKATVSLPQSIKESSPTLSSDSATSTTAPSTTSSSGPGLVPAAARHLPPVTPPNTPLVMVKTADGVYALPKGLSNYPLPADDVHVEEAFTHGVVATDRCLDCVDANLPCEYADPGIPCATCVVRGRKGCSHTNPHAFLVRLSDWRDVYLRGSANNLSSLIQNRRLHPNLFNTHYYLAMEWARRVVQGAIIRFEVRSDFRATSSLGRRGYRQLIVNSNDIAQLSRFIVFAAEANLDAAMIEAATARIKAILIPS
ncbi:hypothetical protein C8F01DRAFT_1164907, partial [Mycena amicta]